MNCIECPWFECCNEIDEDYCINDELKSRPISRWSRQTDTYHDYYECENCGMGVGLDDVRSFCPNCGARMAESEDK